jgi:hypothetical protein
MGPTTTIGRAVPLSPTARQPRGKDRTGGIADCQWRRTTLDNGPGARPTRRAVRFAEATLLAQEAPLGACNSRWHSLPGRGFEKLEQVEPAGKADFRWRRRRVQSQPVHYAARPLPADKVTQSVADQPVSGSEHRHDEVSIHARMGGWRERGTAFLPAQHHRVHTRRRSKVGAVEAVHRNTTRPACCSSWPATGFATNGSSAHRWTRCLDGSRLPATVHGLRPITGWRRCSFRRAQPG